MAAPKIVQSGANLNFCFKLKCNKEPSGYICTIYVKQFPGSTASIERVIPLDSETNTWKGFLTSTETASLDLGHQWLTGSMVNSSEDKAQIDDVPFQVSQGLDN
jgi:hypothetical protein